MIRKIGSFCFLVKVLITEIFKLLLPKSSKTLSNELGMLLISNETRAECMVFIFITRIEGVKG